MNQQLISYIRQQLRANEPRESVMNILLAQGWKASDLDQAFAAVEGEQSVPPAAPTPTPAPVTQPKEFPSPAEVFQSKPMAAQPQPQLQPQPPQQQSSFQPQSEPLAPFAAQAFPGDDQFDEVGGGGQPKPWKDILAFAGLGFGVLSLISFFIPWVGLALAVIGIILCVIGILGSKKLFAIIGLVLCVIGLVGFGVKMMMARPAPVDSDEPGSSASTDTTTTSTDTATNQQPSTPASTNPLLESAAYTDAAGGYSIQPPKGWQAGQGTNNNRTFTIFLSPTSEKDSKGQVVFNENINITSETNKEASADAYVQKSKQALQQFLTGYKVQQEQDVTVNGQPAKLIGGAFTQNGLQLRSLQLFAFKGTTAYVITGLTLATKWTKDSPAIQAALTTFKFQ